MHKTLVLLVLLGYVNLAKSQDDKIVETYVDEILNLEYKSAYAFALNFDDPILVKEFQALANTMYYAGQEENHQPYVIELKEEESTRYCIALLNKGFDELYHNPNKVDSFQPFFAAYTISKNLESIPLQKLCLYGLLEFYHFQYSLTHKEYQSFVDEFGKLAQSDIEKCRYFWYDVYFNLQVSKDNRVDHTLISDFDDEIIKLTKTHKFLPEYYSLKGVYYETLNLQEKGLEYHLKVVSNTKKLPYNKYLLFRTYTHLGEISRSQKQYDKAIGYLKEAENYIDLSDTLKSHMHLNWYRAQVYYSSSDFKRSADNFKDYIEKQLETQYYANNLSNSALKIKLETAEKDKQILIDKQNEAKHLTTITILGIILALGSIITLLYYRNTQRKQRIVAQQLEIESQKLEKVEKEQELAAIDAMILGQEKEREAIANNLHDNVCALLSAAKMQFEHLTERVERVDQEKVDELFDKTKNLLNNAYEEVHSIAYQKNSGVMAKNALLPAVENLVRNNNGIHGITIELQHFGLDRGIESSKEIFIFRIIQELMANIIKHAQATAANISITLHETSISIIVEDNGIGVSEEVILKDKGLGIRNIKKRIQSIHGTMNIDSYINKGTSIIIEIPR